MTTWICPYCSTENNSNEDTCPCCGFNDRKKREINLFEFDCYDTATIKHRIGTLSLKYEVNIPNSYTSIGRRAFNKYLTKVTIPESINNIDEDAFVECDNLSSIIVHKDNIIYSSSDGVLFNKNKTELIKYPKNKKDIEYVVPNTVTHIGLSAFKGCKNLTRVTIPESVTKIEGLAFLNCKKLDDVILPKNIIDIQEKTFFGCKSLKNIVIPSSVKNIGFRAFESCEKLKVIFLPDSVVNIENCAFDNCNHLLGIIIENPKCNINSYLGNLPLKLSICGFKNSTAEKYAQENGINFVDISSNSGKIIYEFYKPK